MIWDAHSNNHFDISLAMVAHTAAAVPGEINAVDTYWIWQEGEDRLTRKSHEIKDGFIDITGNVGLGIEADRDKILEANELYNKECLGERDDSIGMQYLIKDWKFDPKCPFLKR